MLDDIFDAKTFPDETATLLLVPAISMLPVPVILQSSEDVVEEVAT